MSYVYIKEQRQLERVVPNILSKKLWGLDTETNGLDAHNNRVSLIQIGDESLSYLIDSRYVNPLPLKESFFENKEIKKVLHNAKFDYRMLRGSFGICLENIRCTYLAEKVMSAGLIGHYLTKEHKLDRVVKKRLGIVMEDKEEIQKSFINHEGEFTPRQLSYASGDTKYLIPLLKEQSKIMQDQGLGPTFVLECESTLAFGDMEYDGMMLDTSMWNYVLQDNIKKALELERQMDLLAIEIVGADLFGNANINYASPKQVLDLLRKMGVKVTLYNPATRREETSLIEKTNDDILKRIHDNKLVVLLRDWRSYNTLVKNFGLSYIKAVHPKTGCIHPDFYQVGTATGRPAAGESAVNVLNVPRDQKYRSCFTCERDELVESDDFSGCESRILAHISGDPKMLEIFKNGEDIHCGAASLLFGVPVTKSNENKHLRTPAKALNFGGRI